MPILDEPIRTLVPNLVYAGSGREVRLVIVGGRVLMRDGVFLTDGDQAIREQAQLEAQKVARRVAADPLNQELALLKPMAQGYL